MLSSLFQKVLTHLAHSLTISKKGDKAAIPAGCVPLLLQRAADAITNINVKGIQNKLLTDKVCHHNKIPPCHTLTGVARPGELNRRRVVDALSTCHRRVVDLALWVVHSCHRPSVTHYSPVMLLLRLLALWTMGTG